VNTALVLLVKMYYDPFANLDPDLIKPFKPADKTEKKTSEPPVFDPKATEFRPLSKEKVKLEGEGEKDGELVDFSWQVVAAESSGKAVAVFVSSEGQIQVCTSPAFRARCSHPGYPCLQWDSVVLEVAEKETRDTSLASDSPPPEGGHNFTDSGFENGYENGYDNSSEQSSECLLVEGPYVEMDQGQGGGEMYYQQTYTESQLPQGFTTSLPEAIALAPDTIVVEHYPAPVVVQEQYEPWGHQDQTEVSWSSGLGINIPVMSEGGSFTDTFDNTPTYTATYSSPSPHHEAGGGPLSPTGQTQFINLGGLSADMGSLQIQSRRKEKSEEDRLVEREEQRKREEFKKKVLYNLSGSKEEQEQMKIRDSFKDQILSNLRKEQQQKESEEEKVKRAFKDKILQNLTSSAANGTS